MKKNETIPRKEYNELFDNHLKAMREKNADIYVLKNRLAAKNFMLKDSRETGDRDHVFAIRHIRTINDIVKHFKNDHFIICPNCGDTDVESDDNATGIDYMFCMFCAKTFVKE